MKKIDKEELRKVQLSILDRVTSFCDEQDIKYSLYGGTLLGAIRHGGYIPWDDDIDISMPRPDYEKFFRNFHLIEDPNLKLHDFRLNKKYPYPFIKVSDERTLFVEDVDKNITMGINIDIFPIDGLPSTEKESNEIMKKSTFFRNLVGLKRMRLRKNRSLFKNIFLLFARIVLFFVPVHNLISKIIKLTQNYDYESSIFVGNIVWGYGIKERCNKSVYINYIFRYFEKNNYKVMIGYDEYLTNVFNDYMKLPPIENQIAHHSFKAFFK